MADNMMVVLIAVDISEYSINTLKREYCESFL